MIVYEITGLDKANPYYCNTEEEVSRILKKVCKGDSFGIKKIEMTEEEYYNFPAVDIN